MRRVLVIGCSGAGKTVLARRLATATGLPVIHLDRHFWQPGWAQPAKDAWRAELARLMQADAWIMDGNYNGTLPERLARADTVIHLDFPTWICLWRVLRRTVLSLGRTRADMAPGCRERFDWSFLAYVRGFRRDYRPRVLAALRGFPGRRIDLRSPREVRAFLRALPARAEG